jgi:hypothetical protein
MDVALSGVELEVETSSGDSGGFRLARRRPVSPPAVSVLRPPQWNKAIIDWRQVHAALEGQPYAGGGAAPAPAPAPARPQSCDKACGTDSSPVETGSAGRAYYGAGAGSTKKNKPNKTKKKPADQRDGARQQPQVPDLNIGTMPDRGSLMGGSKLAASKDVWWVLIAAFCLGCALGSGLSLAQGDSETSFPPALQCPSLQLPEACSPAEPAATTLAPDRSVLREEQQARARAETALVHCEKERGNLLEQLNWLAVSLKSTGTNARAAASGTID